MIEPDPRQVPDTGTAGAVARPPVLFLVALLLGFTFDFLLPLPLVIAGDGTARLTGAVIGGCLILVGIAVFAAGIRDLTNAKTPVQGTRPTRVLVTTGIHGWSRNPIYLGMFAIYGGIGIAALSQWILIFILPLALTIRYGVVAREEIYLERRFGDDYLEYKAGVRRWL